MGFEDLFRKKVESGGDNREIIEKGVLGFLDHQTERLNKKVNGWPEEDRKLDELLNGRGSIKELFPQGF